MASVRPKNLFSQARDRKEHFLAGPPRSSNVSVRARATGCEQAFQAASAECPAETGAYLGCVQTRAVLECSPRGEAIPAGDLTPCASAFRAFQACTACVPASIDSGCQTCTKTSCCSQYEAYLTNPDYLAVLTCLAGCSTTSTTCVSDCSTRYRALSKRAKC